MRSDLHFGATLQIIWRGNCSAEAGSLSESLTIFFDPRVKVLCNIYFAEAIIPHQNESRTIIPEASGAIAPDAMLRSAEISDNQSWREIIFTNKAICVDHPINSQSKSVSGCGRSNHRGR